MRYIISIFHVYIFTCIPPVNMQSWLQASPWARPQVSPCRCCAFLHGLPTNSALVDCHGGKTGGDLPPFVVNLWLMFSPKTSQKVVKYVETCLSR